MQNEIKIPSRCGTCGLIFCDCLEIKKEEQAQEFRKSKSCDRIPGECFAELIRGMCVKLSNGKVSPNEAHAFYIEMRTRTEQFEGFLDYLKEMLDKILKSA
jgi:hypothetical protein